MKPIIGVVYRLNEDENNLYVNNTLINCIIAHQAIPFLILPTSNFNDLDEILKKCDGIILPGGTKWDKDDEYICKYAIENDVPLLGICAGMQVLAKILNNGKIDGVDNTILNNTFINHKSKDNYAHDVRILKNTKLYEIIKKDKIKVNSRHSYHVPDSYIKSAIADDNIIEAVEYSENKFTLGIQWHPESMISYDEDARKIFDEFIKNCKNKY